MLIDKNTSKLSDGYIVQGIAILVNECPESSKQGNFTLTITFEQNRRRTFRYDSTRNLR